MVLTLLRGIGQLFYKMSLCFGLSDFLVMIKFRLFIVGKKIPHTCFSAACTGVLLPTRGRDVPSTGKEIRENLGARCPQLH